MTAKSNSENAHVKAVLGGVVVLIANFGHPQQGIGITENTVYAGPHRGLGFPGIDDPSQTNIVYQSTSQLARIAIYTLCTSVFVAGGNLVDVGGFALNRRIQGAPFFRRHPTGLYRI